MPIRPNTESGYFANGNPLTGTKGTPISAAWLNDLIDSIETVEQAQAAGMIGKTTKALLDADLAHAGDTLGYVVTDATAANNGVYIKTGAPGAGAWEPSTFDRLIVAMAAVAENLALTRQNGRLTPVVREQRIFLNAGNKILGTDYYSSRNWQEQQNIIEDKIINCISIAIARNFVVDGVFTQPILVRIGLNDDWIISREIGLDELAPYNALAGNAPAADFDYFIDLPDTKLLAGDRLYIGWECGAADLMTMLYADVPVPAVEGADGLVARNITPGLVAGLATPPVIGAGEGFTLRVNSYYRRYTSEAPAGDRRADLTILPPKKIYTVLNDTAATHGPEARNMAIPIYLDHMLNGLTSEPDLSFVESGSDRVALYAHDPDGDFAACPTVFNIASRNDYNSEVITVEHVTTAESVGKVLYPKLLCIGDSVTAGYLSGMNVPAGSAQQFWANIKNEMEKARIDNGDDADEFNFLAIGRYPATWDLTYKGVVERSLRAAAEGFGGWNSTNHIQQSRNWYPMLCQGMWDLLGLGNGSGADYVNSLEQQLSIVETPEGYNTPINTAQFIAYIDSQLGGAPATYAAAVGILDNKQANPDNPFYSKTTAEAGVVAFSLAAYLARYKTLNNDGVTRLGVGTTAGTKVVDAAASDVCLPTHIILQHSHNDGNVSWFGSNLRRWTDAIKAEYTAQGWGTIYIGLSVVDHTGTYFPSRYPDFDASVNLWDHPEHDKSWHNQQRVFEEFWVSSENEDAEKIYLLPTYHIGPTAWATPSREIPLPDYQYNGLGSSVIKQAWGSGIDWHPNGIAHRCWGISMYAWIKHTLGL